MSEERLTLLVHPEADVRDRIRLAQIAAGLQPEDLATAIGVSVRTYQRILEGTRNVRRGELVAIALRTNQEVSFFGASPDAGGAGVLTGVASPVNGGAKQEPTAHDVGTRRGRLETEGA